MKVSVYGIVNLAIKPYNVVKGGLAKENSYMVGRIQVHTQAFTQESTQFKDQGTKKKRLDQQNNREEEVLFMLSKQSFFLKLRQDISYLFIKVSHMENKQAKLFPALAQGLR